MEINVVSPGNQPSPTASLWAFWAFDLNRIQPCVPGDDSLTCRLSHIQGVLEVLAYVLGAVLVLVVLLAVRFWLRHRVQERREDSRRGPDRAIR